MAKRHSADDELSDALANLAEIEAAVAEWLPGKTPQPAETKTADATKHELTDQPDVAEPSIPARADAAVFVMSIDAVAGQTSALVRFVRHLDDAIHAIIIQASDSEILSFHEKLLRRFRLSLTPQDMHRRDGMLAAPVVTSLERAARLIAALDTHRQIMRSRLVLIEEDLIKRIERTKSISDETGAIADAAEQLSNRQDVAEAVIRHEAACNILYHKLGIEAERGIVVLRALIGGQDRPLAGLFSSEAGQTFSPLLALSDKHMLSMREVERRKHAIDENFMHRFNPGPAGRADGGADMKQTFKTDQAPA